MLSCAWPIVNEPIGRDRHPGQFALVPTSITVAPDFARSAFTLSRRAGGSLSVEGEGTADYLSRIGLCLSLFSTTLDFSIVSVSREVGMKRLETEKLETDAATKVWSVHDFCKRHRLCEQEERRLTRLFGMFATARELLNNAQRTPKWR